MHFIFYVLTIIVPLGYGILLRKILIRKNSIVFDIGTIGFFGFFLLLFLSLLFHYFITIGYYFSSIILIIGIILFFININEIKLLFTKINIVVLLLIYPLSIIFYLDEDFNYYYLPYLTYLESSKIIFGLVNLNDALVSSQNTLYDMFVFFKLPYLVEKGYSIVGVSFLFFFLSFLFSQIKKNSIQENIFLFFVIIISVSTFDKLRDIGASVPSQLLMIISLVLIFMIINSKIHVQNIILALFYFLFAFLLRVNAIIILPFIFLVLIIYYKYLYDLFLRFKLFISFNFLIFSLFIIKNLIISGCIVYPIYYSCFEKNFTWAASVDKSITKIAVFQAFSKGWMYYARDNLGISDKYVWKNINDDSLKSVEEYAKSSMFFWSKYWFKDHDYKRIINLFLIGLSIFLIVFFANYKIRLLFKYSNYKKNLLSNKFNLFFFIAAILSVFLWYKISPQTRYGGFSIFIILSSFVFSQFINKTIYVNKINFTIFHILIFLAFTYSFSKNVIRINQDYFIKSENITYFPWPNYVEVNENTDYLTEMFWDTKINLRIKTDKLYLGNINSNDKYFLLCGSIPFPCMLERNKVCVKDIIIKNNYMFVYHNYKEKKCRKLFQNNMVF